MRVQPEFQINRDINVKPLHFVTFYCETCEHQAVLCPKCGNNSCNSGIGEFLLDNGDYIDCNVCPLSWQVADEIVQSNITL